MNENNALKFIRCAKHQSNRTTAEHAAQLLSALGDPSHGMKIIRIFGEAGRSTFARRLSCLLTDSGFSAGILSLSHPENASEEHIQFQGTPLSSAFFTAAVNRVAEAEKALDGPSATAEALLLATGLLALRELKCQFVLLEMPNNRWCAASALGSSLLRVVMPLASEETARTVCSLLGKTGSETVSTFQPPAVLRLLTEQCAAINGRLTVPIKTNFYETERTLGRIRFFYDRTEYLLAGGAYYEIALALALIETNRALLRVGVKLDRGSVFVALQLPPSPTHFQVLSLSPTVILDAADSPMRLSAFLESIVFQKELLGNIFDVWTEPSLEAIVRVAFQNYPSLSPGTVVCIGEQNPYRTVKLALRTREPNRPLLVVGSDSFVQYIKRIWEGFQ